MLLSEFLNTNNIIIGTDNTNENFFKGTINELLLKQTDEIIIHYKNIKQKLI